MRHDALLTRSSNLYMHWEISFFEIPFNRVATAFWTLLLMQTGPILKFAFNLGKRK